MATDALRVQDWKKGAGLAGSMLPKFQPEPDLAELATPREPTFRMCRFVNEQVLIPEDARKRWLQDPIRSSLPAFWGAVFLWLFTQFSPVMT